MAKTITRKNNNPVEVFLIQFITDDPLLIPGTGSVAVRGQLLEVGQGKLGAGFPYRTPEEQVAHYGEQKYVLIAAYDSTFSEIDHADIERTADGGTAFIDPEDADVEPALQNRGTNVVGDDPGMESKSKTSKPKTSKSKSSSKPKGKSKNKDSKSKSKKSSK